MQDTGMITKQEIAEDQLNKEHLKNPGSRIGQLRKDAYESYYQPRFTIKTNPTISENGWADAKGQRYLPGIARTASV